LTEHETIELGQKLLVQLNELHKEKVIHSNLNKSSVYWVDGEIQFLDLELAIWDPIDILKKPNAYFQQLEGDKYDITFRDEEFLAPEHKELADEYQTTGNIPSSKIEASCDIYSIGAILFTALTGKKVKTYTEEIAIITEDSNKSPKCLDDIIISNEMVKFIMKILHKNPKERFEDISKVQKELKRIYESLEKIPKKLLKCLEHIPIKNPDKKLKYFQDDYVLQLQQYAFNDFCLDYIYKFILESNIPNIRIFGAAVFPLRQLRLNQITSLELSGQTIHAEELKILSFFIKINSSLTDIDLSK
jgi:serine/threonine protein kinase